MNDAEFLDIYKRHIKLESVYRHATNICLPDEFVVRQRILLEAIANFLLEPYHQAVSERLNEKDEQ